MDDLLGRLAKPRWTQTSLCDCSKCIKLPDFLRQQSAQTVYRHKKADEKRRRDVQVTVLETTGSSESAAPIHGPSMTAAASQRARNLSALDPSGEIEGEGPRLPSSPSGLVDDFMDFQDNFIGADEFDDFEADLDDTHEDPIDSGYLSDHRSQRSPSRGSRSPAAHRSPPMDSASPHSRPATPDQGRHPLNPPEGSDEDQRERERLLGDHEATELAPAFKEILPVRLAYLSSVLGHIFSHQTVEASQRILRTSLTITKLYEPLPTRPKPATTVQTATRRLGINVDDYIRRIPICDACFKPYTLEEINKLDSPACVGQECKDGVVYETTGKRARGPEDGAECGDEEIRKPKKIQAYSSITAGIRRLLLRRDFVDNLVDMEPYIDPAPRQSDEPMHDIHDGAQFGQLPMGMKRVLHPDGTVSDVEVEPGSRKKLAECELGLSGMLNIDWYGATKNRPHSSGAVYLAFNNLHRSVRFLPHNIHVVTMIPGPKEPKLEHINHVFEPVKEELEVLYKGVIMVMYGRQIPPRVHVGIELHVSDIQALRKIIMMAGHAHKTHPCNICHIAHDDINLPAGYDIEDFKIRDDFDHLKHAFRSKAAKSARARTLILNETGMRYTVLNELPGWKPIKSSGLDLMHNIYSGKDSVSIRIVAHEFDEVIVAGYLLDASDWRKFQDIINSIVWPSGIGRLPKDLGKNHSLQKADQWRTWCNIKTTVLFLLWRDKDDKIRTDPRPIPPQSKTVPTFDRDLPSIYESSMYLTVAERILAKHEISRDNVERGQRYLQRHCQGLLRLGVHLVMNHHLAMHYVPVFTDFGPAYAWWLFAFERCNGDQEKVKLNGHADGEMELTMLRNMVGKQRLHELRVSLPADAHEEERALLEEYIDLKGLDRGTLRTEIAGFAAGGTIRKPQQRGKTVKYTDLRRLSTSNLNIYGLILSYARTFWPDVDIVNDLTLRANTVPLVASTCAIGLPFLYKNGLRFGSFLDGRSEHDRVALIDFADGQVPCRLLYHFELIIPGKPSTVCSVVQRMLADQTIPLVPWSLHSGDIAVHLVYRDRYLAAEVVPSSHLASAVLLVPMYLNRLGRDKPLWAVHSFDRTGVELEEEWLQEAVNELEGGDGEATA